MSWWTGTVTDYSDQSETTWVEPGLGRDLTSVRNKEVHMEPKDLSGFMNLCHLGSWLHSGDRTDWKAKTHYFPSESIL